MTSRGRGRNHWVPSSKGDFLAPDNLPIEHYHSNGKLWRQSYYDETGQLHNAHGPALIEYDANEQISKIAFYSHGLLDRDDAPALVLMKNGIIQEETYYAKGKIHRLNGPAQRLFYPNGKLREISFQQYGLYHRRGAAALTRYFDNGATSEEVYYIRGQYHNNPDPAWISYYRNGLIYWQRHYTRGELVKEEYPNS